MAPALSKCSCDQRYEGETRDALRTYDRWSHLASKIPSLSSQEAPPPPRAWHRVWPRLGALLKDSNNPTFLPSLPHPKLSWFWPW